MDFLRRAIINEATYHVLPTNDEAESLSTSVRLSSPIPAQRDGSNSDNGGSQKEINLTHKDGYYPAPTIAVNLRRWLRRFPSLAGWTQYSEHIKSVGDSTKSTRKVHPTAWLDGLRGVASLCVVFHHSTVMWNLSLNNGWGCNPGSRFLVQLPIIRLIISGSAMVAVFFIVSGFSLSYKALALIRNGQHQEVLDCLSSSVFRRGLRLTIPPAVVHFFAMLATYAGFYGTGPGSRQPPRFETLGENIALWMRSVIELGDPFRPSVYPGGYDPMYDTNLWTIPVEFHGSMVIFLTLIGLAKVHAPVRLFVLSGLVLYLLYFAYTHLFLFLGGVWLAELGHMREARKKDRKSLQEILPSDPDRSLLQDSEVPQWVTLTNVSWTACFLLALFVLSMPLTDFGARDSPGFMTLSTLIPFNYRRHFFEDQFWIHLGAMLVVFSVDNSQFLQPLFTNRFSQWLGKISFALYILHGHFLYTLGWHLSAKTVAWTGAEPGFHYGFGIFLAAVVMYPLLFWTAHVVAKHVDARSVTFARWLYMRLSQTT